MKDQIYNWMFNLHSTENLDIKQIPSLHVQVEVCLAL